MNSSPRSIGLLLFAVTIGASVLSGYLLDRENRAVYAERYESLTRELETFVTSQMANYEKALLGVRGAVITGGRADITRHQFIDFFNSRRFLEEFPGVRGVGYADRVPADGVEDYIDRARQDGFPDFRLRELNPHQEERFVIRYIYPLEGNEGATGLDIGSEGNRRRAALKAASSGTAQLTEPITLVQASGQKNAGFLLLMPVYEEGADISTAAKREAASIGWTYSPIVVDEVLARLGLRRDEIAFSITDAGNKVTFFKSAGFDETRASGSLDFPMFGRLWHVEHHLLPPFVARYEQASPYSIALLVLLSGTLVSVSVFGIARNRQRLVGLRERSQQLTEAVVDGAPLALLVLDKDRHIIRANRRSTELFGEEAGALVGKSLDDLVHPREQDNSDTETSDACAAGFEVELVGRRADGSEFPVILQMSEKSLPDTDLLIAGIIDVSTQQEAIRVLSESEERWQELADHLPHLVWTSNASGECEFLSRQWMEYTGRPAEEQLGVAWMEQVHPDDRGKLRDAWRRSVQELQPFSVEFRIRRFDGKYRLFYTQGEPIIDESGEVLRWIGSNTDIEDRHRAEQEIMELLREMEQRVADRTEELDTALRVLNNILDAIPSPIAYWDRNQINRIANAAHKDWFGRDPEWTRGRHAIDLLGEEVYADVSEKIDEVLRGKPQQAEREMVDASGNRRVAAVHYIPDIRDGEVNGFYVVLFDITEIKKSEDAQKVARQAAEEATRAKTAFLASMSHELRTPMNSILGFSDLMLSQHFGKLNAKQLDYSGTIRKSAEHLLRLMDSVLELSKIELGKVAVSIEPVNVVSSVRSVISTLEPLAESYRIEVRELKMIPADLYVEADQTRLLQILINLGSNAIKYNRPGGWIDFGCEITDDDMVRITVSDNGFGIPLDRQKDTFEAFNRLGAEQGTIEGSGIGLTLVRNFVELMGGRVQFESKEGEGSRFWIELPLSEAVEAAEHATLLPQPEEMPAASGEQVSVLYIEDNEINRQLFRNYAEMIGGVVLTEAENGLDGLKAARAMLPDIIFLDINLPGLDGYGVVKALKADRRTAGIEVVALTANAMAGDADKGIEAGFDAYLTKPVRLDHIKEKVGAFRMKAAS